MKRVSRASRGIVDQTRLLIRNHGGYSLIRHVIFNTGLTP